VHGARLLTATALVAAGLATSLSPVVSPARASSPERPAWGGAVSRLPVEPPGIDEADEADEAAITTGRRNRCVDVERVRSAVALGERIIELKLRGGSTFHMRFAEDCPFIAFYDGFYYQSDLGGRLCARRDAVIARSGGACTIDSITRAQR
jgi:hypothetical protein